MGEFKDGKRHGQGTVTIPNGSKYEGEWKEDKPHGAGTITFAFDGVSFEGQWMDARMQFDAGAVSAELEDAALQPQWKHHVYPDKRSYQGTMVGTSREGHGVYIDKRRNHFEGSWVSDQATGYGVKVCPFPFRRNENHGFS